MRVKRMTENDYIAEYVKEKYSSILGVDFAIWKGVKMARTFINGLVDVFSNLDIKGEDKEDSGLSEEEKDKIIREKCEFERER